MQQAQAVHLVAIYRAGVCICSILFQILAPFLLDIKPLVQQLAPGKCCIVLSAVGTSFERGTECKQPPSARSCSLCERIVE